METRVAHRSSRQELEPQHEKDHQQDHDVRRPQRPDHTRHVVGFAIVVALVITGIMLAVVGDGPGQTNATDTIATEKATMLARAAGPSSSSTTTTTDDADAIAAEKATILARPAGPSSSSTTTPDDDDAISAEKATILARAAGPTGRSLLNRGATP